MQKILTEADYVSIHTPLNKNTANLISKNELAMMKSSAFIVNTSRCGVVDESALYEALTKGTIRGAALDVLEKEPPDANNALLSLENVLITPHAAFYSENAVEEVRIRSAQAVINVYKGMLPDNIINNEIIKNKKLRMIVNSD
jgi:D-3-phosphoglycerate dehydrogenase